MLVTLSQLSAFTRGLGLATGRSGALDRAVSSQAARDAMFVSVLWSLVGLVLVAAGAILLDLFRKRGKHSGFAGPPGRARAHTQAGAQASPDTPRDGEETQV